MGHKPTYSTDVQDITRNNVVQVEDLNAFPESVAGIITLLTSTTYVLTKAIDFGILQLKIPDDGIVILKAENDFMNVMQSRLTGTTPFLIGSISRLEMRDISVVSLSGEGAGFDLTAGATQLTPPTFSLNRSTFTGFKKIGTMDGLTFLSENTGLINAELGITLKNMIVIKFEESILGITKGNQIILEGTLFGANFSGLVSTPSAGFSMFEISPSLFIISAMAIDLSIFISALGGTVFASPGLDQTDPKIRTFSNTGITDSFFKGSTGFTNNSTPTIFSDTTTPVKVAGTYEEGFLERYTTSNGVLTYIGFENIAPLVTGLVSPVLTPETERDTIEVFFFKNGNEIVGKKVVKQLTDVWQTPTPPAFMLTDHIPLVTNDTLELRWRNITKPTDIVASDAKIIAG
jgi:hypothetical protein